MPTPMMNFGKIQEIAAKEILKRTGLDMRNPRDYNKVKRHVIARNNRITAGWGKQHELFQNSEYLNSSLFSGGQRIDFTFQDWQVSKQPEGIEKAREVGNRCYALAKRMINEPMKVLLTGGPGVGKTSLAMAILNMMANEGFSVMVISTNELAHLMGKQYEASDVKDRLEYTEKMMKSVDVLLLDDLGTDSSMKDIRQARKDLQELLFTVSNARLDLKRNEVVHSTVITTNNTMEQLNQTYNAKLISRLLPHNQKQIVDFSGLKDVRK